MAAAVYDRVLVTGGSGFLGRAVGAVLPGARLLGRRDVDLTDGGAVATLLADVAPEVVVHLAARVGGITANMAQPADFLLDNMRIDANVCAALRRSPPRHFIAVLSTCMYPDRLHDDQYPMDEALLEAGPPPPTNAAYASAKRCLWHATRALHAQYEVPFTALVPANLYGPGDHFESAQSHFLAAAINRLVAAQRGGAGRVEFFGTGTALRQYVYVHDLARLVAAIVEQGPLLDTFNVAPHGHATIRQLAEAAALAVGYSGEVAFTGTGPDGQYRKDVSSKRLRAALPAWSDMETPLPEGLAATVAWHRHHLGGSA